MLLSVHNDLNYFVYLNLSLETLLELAKIFKELQTDMGLLLQNLIQDDSHHVILFYFIRYIPWF